MSTDSISTTAPASTYRAEISAADHDAWNKFGGRHSFECFTSRPNVHADGRRSGLCQCGNRCGECASSAAALKAAGLSVMGFRYGRR